MSEEPDIEIRDNREAHRFEASVEGKLAIVDYNLTQGGIVVAHTEVPKPLEGRGIARRLYQAVLAAARAEGRRVIPVCPVFALYLERHPETHDAIDPGYRRSLGLPPLDPAGSAGC
jgi:predicted GNAT family acetyltransferase